MVTKTPRCKFSRRSQSSYHKVRELGDKLYLVLAWI
jgi:hypothetical protein